MQTYEGSCHCGAVRWRVTMDPPQKAFTGNCSICSRMGWLLASVPESSFELLAGEEALSDYQFGRKNVHHLFCRTCGIRSFTRGKNQRGEPMAVVNLRCVPELEPGSLPVQSFDCKAM